MKKTVLLLLLALSPLLSAYMLSVPTRGDYGKKRTLITYQATATSTFVAPALTALVGNCSCPGVVATWYAPGVWGIQVSNNDQSAEAITLLGITPTIGPGGSQIYGGALVAVATRLNPSWRVHKDRWGNAILFEVVNTCTPTFTCAASSSMTPCYNVASPTPTATPAQTATFTCAASSSMTPCYNVFTTTFTPTFTYTPTNTYTPSPTYTGSWIATATQAQWTVTNTYTVTPTFTFTPPYTNTPTMTLTYTPTTTWSNTPAAGTNTWTPTFTFTPTFSPSPIPTWTATCNPSWTPGCWNR